MTTCSYAPCGNQIASETPAGHVTSTTWDHENFPTVVEQPDGDRVTMTYGTNTRNAHRQRVCRETTCGETWSLWDNRNVLWEHDESGTPEVAYVHEPVPEPEPFGKLVAQHRDDQAGWYHFDPQGTTAALTDEAGVIVQDYAHDAWGNLLSQTNYGPAAPNPYTYVGQYGYQKDTARHPAGDYLARRRVYDPRTARWHSEDPLGLQAGDENFYRYVKQRSSVGPVPPAASFLGLANERSHPAVTHRSRGGRTRRRGGRGGAARGPLRPRRSLPPRG